MTATRSEFFEGLKGYTSKSRMRDAEYTAGKVTRKGGSSHLGRCLAQPP